MCGTIKSLITIDYSRRSTKTGFSWELADAGTREVRRIQYRSGNNLTYIGTEVTTGNPQVRQREPLQVSAHEVLGNATTSALRQPPSLLRPLSLSPRRYGTRTDTRAPLHHRRGRCQRPGFCKLASCDAFVRVPSGAPDRRAQCAVLVCGGVLRAPSEAALVCGAVGLAPSAIACDGGREVILQHPSATALALRPKGALVKGDLVFSLVQEVRTALHDTSGMCSACDSWTWPTV